MRSSGASVSRIVVVEYPKSGGSWIVGLLGDTLGLPKRDIYMSDGASTAFDLAKHPWYRGAASWNVSPACVVKSHELPDSPLSRSLQEPGTRTVHVVRDGRDVTVSKYFFERDFCVRNGILPALGTSFDDFVPQTAAAWRGFVDAWAGRADVVCRYESFLADAAGATADVIAQLGLAAPRETVEAAVAANTRERFARSLDAAFAHNTFVRVGRSGDWRNHFEPRHLEAFTRASGTLLRALGYLEHEDGCAAAAPPEYPGARWR